MIKKRSIRIITLLLLLAMLFVTSFSTVGSAITNNKGNEGEAPINSQALKQEDIESYRTTYDQMVTMMVKLSDSPAAVTVENINSNDAQLLEEFLEIKQERIKDEIIGIMPNDIRYEFKHSYTLLFNGFAITAPLYMMEEIERIEGVEKVFISPAYTIPQDMKEEDTKLSTSIGLIGADDAWSAGYTGAGTTVAVIDTGAKVSHDAFSTAPVDPSMSTSTIADVLLNNDLQAETLYSGSLSASTLYYSQKIPFRFNYAEGTNDVSHASTGNDHGTHVAGIAAGNYPESNYVGVAKDAQLIIMQVFNSNGNAEWYTILAALEDCAYLGVDAVNMSLGTDCGFTSDGDEIDAVYGLLYQHGVNIACAASNSKTYSGDSYSYAFTMNQDNGLVGSPSTYRHSLSVAASTKSASPSIASYSSWGTTSDLKLKPEVTAPGSGIYSSTDSDYNSSDWGSKSGTSMASPHVAGAMALVSEYVDSTFSGFTAIQRMDMINRLLMCTATPAKTVNAPYSPRQQGAGVIDINKALTTRAYVTVEGCSRPKLELGDDKARTGVYELTFNVVNFGSSELTYTVNPYVLTENYSSQTVNGQTVYSMAGTPWNITSSCLLNYESTVTVPADSTKTITVTVTLDSAVKSLLDSCYPNGAYIEGFITLDGDVDLVVPYLAFYGNWNEASVFDRYTFIDELRGENNWGIISRRTEVGSVTNGTAYMLLGANPYIASNDWLADRCTLSPNGDTYYDRIDKVAATLIRNAKVFGIKIYNAADPSIIYYQEEYNYMPKTWKYSGSVYYQATDWMRFTDWEPTNIPEGSTVVFSMYAPLDNPDFTHEQNECSQLLLPCTIDNTPPQVTYWNVDYGNLTVRVYDEHYAAWIGVYSDAECTDLIAEQAIAETARGAYTDMRFEVGEHEVVYVKVGDYGRNTSAVYTLKGEGGSITPVELTGITISPGTVELLREQTEALVLKTTPADANHYDVVWSSSDTNIVTVTGAKNNAVITSVSDGRAAITATATDMNTGVTYTANAEIRVMNGYTYTRYEPVDTIETGIEYLIGYKSGSDVYLLMNYNPNPFADNNYYYSYDNNYYGYGIKAVMDGKYVVDVDKTVYLNAAVENAEWRFTANRSYYTIQSAYDELYYLSVYQNSTHSDLYPSMNSANASNWQWNPVTGRLSYCVNSHTTKYAAYLAKAGSHSSFFKAPTTVSAESTIQLYKKTMGTINDGDDCFVTFVDWDGTVLKTEEVEDGGRATPPDDPERIGHTFTGWSGSYVDVVEDVTITATYAINSYILTVNYKYVNGTTATVSCNEIVVYGNSYSVTSPTIAGYSPNISVVTGIMGAEDMVVEVIYRLKSYTLTIRYLYEDGTTAAPTYAATYRYGNRYSVVSPVINGFIADMTVVEGEMGGQNTTIIVRYISNSTVLIGDANGDGRVSFIDVSVMFSYIVNYGRLDGIGRINADINGDGVITFVDVSMLYSKMINS